MAKAALISETAAPTPVGARGRPDARLALRDESKKAPGVA
jgi:hypothetical protein